MGTKKKKEINVYTSPEFEKEQNRVIPKGEGFHTQDYKTDKFLRDEDIKRQRRYMGIQKELKKLRKQKYNVPEQVEYDGIMWDVQSGKAVKEKDKEEKDKKEVFDPDAIIEDLLFGDKEDD